MYQHEQRSLLREPYLAARLEPSTRYDSEWRHTTDSVVCFTRSQSHCTRSGYDLYQSAATLVHPCGNMRVSICVYIGTHTDCTTCDDQHLKPASGVPKSLLSGWQEALTAVWTCPTHVKYYYSESCCQEHCQPATTEAGGRS